jgi:hypothetical protein
MDASGKREEAKGSPEEASDISWKTDASGEVPSVDSPKLVPEPGAHKESVKAAARSSTVTALVIAGHRFEKAAGDAGARTRTTFDAFAVKFRGLHFPKVSPFAATVLLAASIGAVAGSLGTFAVSIALAPSQAQQMAEARMLKETIARLSADLTGVRAGAEAAIKSSAGQLARMAERLDRAEKQQRVAMAAPALVSPATIPAGQSPVASASSNMPSNEVTGSIPSQRPAPLGFNKDNSRPVISGWVLQNVYDGTAYIQSRDGPMEVMVGDALPDGGRVEAIRRMNGRWVVVTTNGLVVMR